jgi:hypothetical protein
MYWVIEWARAQGFGVGFFATHGVKKVWRKVSSVEILQCNTVFMC